MAATSSYHVQFLLLCLLLCTIMCNSKIVPCDDKEKSTLLRFKHGVTDPSGVLSSWSIEEKDCCQWKGVYCDNTTGKVTELNLPCPEIYPVYGNGLDKSHCLTGELNMSSLFDLEFLHYLDLSYNDFNTIQSRSQLENFSTSNIHHLDLSYNDNLQADNILYWISNISSLQYLDLSGINLQKETNWLQSLTGLPSLTVLGLVECGLRDIYPSLHYANFTALEVIDIAANDFMPNELPTWVFNLSSILSITLAHNFLHGQLPETLPNFQNLDFLNLEENDISGPIPNWVGQLEKLQILLLASNSFSGSIPHSLGNLSSLSRLSLQSNFLTGNVSERNFHSFSRLKSLGLGSPSLIFDFDPDWIPPFQLQFLILSFVSPKLPSWVYTQNSLTLLNIMNSSISLEAFHKFWKFAADQVEYLYLSSNSINGNMSNVLLNSKVVWLKDNNLRGGLPLVSPNVTLLDLSYNSLSGSISHFLCPKTNERNNLKYLDISHNLLSEDIPDCWMHWESLLYINLEDNNLIGQIPHSIGSLSNLFSLTLYNNMLSGEVPLSLKNCKNLRLLNLGGNKFSGAISNWVGQSIIFLQLRSNQFSGNISTTICQLHSLKILDLSDNRLSGSIPSCCRNITSMISKNESFDSFHITVLVTNVIFEFDVNVMLLIKGIKLNYTHSIRVVDLSSNNLSGSVPSELFMLIGLQSLNLSHNQLMGMIPQDIGNLALLESLDLSNNLFSGQIPQSMSSLSFLEALNLSCNNFEGKIPSGTQLQGFSNLSYVENPRLCGPPLTKICPQDDESRKKEDDEDNENSEIYSWFYMGSGIGFATSFWTILGIVFFNRRFRHAYFRFLSQLYDMMIQKFNFIS